jgi:hypothetical protein
LLGSTGQSIRRSIGGALLVDDFVLQAHETKECLLLDERVKFVITQVYNSALVSVHGEWAML